MTDRIKVAIIGAGTCGALLAAGLSKHHQVDFEIFESQSENDFREADSDMEMGRNAVAALKAMGLDQERLFAEAGARTWHASRCIVAVGEHKGEALIKLKGHTFMVLKHRWQQELIKLIPGQKIHYGKKLNCVSEEWRGPCQLQFEDGSTSQADVVIGCDGIHSRVRELVLDRGHTLRTKARPSGYWDVFGKMSRDKAVALFGSDLMPFKENEVALTGDGTAMLFRSSADPEKYDVVMAGIYRKADEIVGHTFDKAFLRRMYQNWDPKIIDAVAKWILEEDKNAYVIHEQRESQEVPMYFRGLLGMIGDTAHKMSPWTGSNAGLEVEDVAVMAALLGAVGSHREDMEAALIAFDQTRRGRPEQLQRRTRLVAQIMTGQLGLDPKRITPLQPEKWWEERDSFDIEAHIREALAHLDALCKIGYKHEMSKGYITKRFPHY